MPDPADPILPTRTRERIAADNRAELDAWIDERATQLVARGMAMSDARRHALEEFGDIATAERYAQRQDVAADRRVRVRLLLEEIGADLRIAARTLRRTPAVTGVVLLTFALGIGATTAVFSVVHALFLRPLPYADEDRLVYLLPLDKGAVGPNPRHSAAAFITLRETTTSFASLTSVETGSYVITDGGEPEQVRGSALTANGSDVLRAPPAIGRVFRPDEASGPANVVVLLDAIWRRRFGADSSILGRMIDISGTRMEVIGVMAPAFRVPMAEDAQLLVPRDLSRILANRNARNVRVLRVVARLKPGASLETAQAEVDRTMRELREQSPTLYSDVSVSVVPIRTAITGAARLRLFVLMGAAAFVLVIACANVAGVLLSRALARRHELAVRVALGAGRRRLLRQFMAEGAVLAAAGALLGLFVAQLGIITLRRITTTALPEGTTFSLEPKVLLFALGVAVVSAFAASLVPSLAATRALGIAFRHDDGRASASRASRRIRLGLVAGQLAVSVVLLVGAGLFLRTLHGLLALNLGYTTEHVLTFRNVFTQPKRDAEQDAFYRALYAGLRSLPRVISVGGGAVPTTGSSFITGLEIEGRTVERARLPQVRNSTASDDYFAALGIPILRGRAFNAQDHESDPWVGVISDRLAKEQWPRADPIGARVKLDPQNPWITIVGIVGDVRMGGAEEAQPSVYTSQRQDHWPGGSSVVIRTDGDPLALAANVRQVVRRVDPSVLIVGLRSLDEFRRSTPSIAERRMLLQLLVTFAVVALMVSAIGVYGVSAYATEARRREFGIRIALGATRNGVLRLALREAAQVAVSGTLAGVPLALLLARRLGAMLYQVAPFDPLTLSAVLGALFLVVMAASFVPARRATLIDPARTMRTE